MHLHMKWYEDPAGRVFFHRYEVDGDTGRALNSVPLSRAFVPENLYSADPSEDDVVDTQTSSSDTRCGGLKPG